MQKRGHQFDENPRLLMALSDDVIRDSDKENEKSQKPAPASSQCSPQIGTLPVLFASGPSQRAAA